ncbi:MAG: histidine phosphatase family protein [Sporichthyaceae bacterium]
MPPGTYRQTGFRTPPGATDVLLIRHGQTAPMPADDSYPRSAEGNADPDLSEIGRAQADRLGERLGTAAIDAIYVSSLVRTHQTAAPMAAALGLTPVADPDLREVHLGEWEGGEFRRRAELHDPLVTRLFREGTWEVIPGAETAAEFGGRVGAALARIHAAHPGDRVAVVCHGGVIGQAVALASGASPVAFAHVDNGSISQLILYGDRWIVRRINDTAHLGQEFATEAAAVI